MMKSSGGVARLRDVTDWRPPRTQSGCIVLSNPKTGTPTVEISAAREVPRQAPAVPSGSGAITSADFGPWKPPRSQPGLIREGKWIDLSDLPASSAPPEEQPGLAAESPKRRTRKR
ncbi:MAG: hypothetical protein ACJ8J0_17445 [Longimicrobiaceae bacterium]